MCSGERGGGHLVGGRGSKGGEGMRRRKDILSTGSPYEWEMVRERATVRVRGEPSRPHYRNPGDPALK